MKIPSVKIKYNKFLDPLARCYFQHRFKLTLLENKNKNEDIKDTVAAYIKEWRKYEKITIMAIQNFLSLEFRRNIIDVHIVEIINRSFSNPLVFDTRNKPSEFVDKLIHELIHVILQENNDVASWESVDWLEKKFPKESRVTRNHIIVHAVLKKVYLEILKEPERLGANMTRSKKHSSTDYTRAWDIVDKQGADYLLKKFKQEYRG